MTSRTQRSSSGLSPAPSILAIFASTTPWRRRARAIMSWTSTWFSSPGSALPRRKEESPVYDGAPAHVPATLGSERQPLSYVRGSDRSGLHPAHISPRVGFIVTDLEIGRRATTEAVGCTIEGSQGPKTDIWVRTCERRILGLLHAPLCVVLLSIRRIPAFWRLQRRPPRRLQRRPDLCAA